MAGRLIAGMAHDPNKDELRRLERFCMEQAQECATAEGRVALLSMGADYRAAVCSTARRASGR
jgi:hypothetical protein